MKFYGKAEETARRILTLFENPQSLPDVLAPVFIRSKADAPCRAWSWRNQILCAIAGTADARGYRQWQEAGRHVVKGAKAFDILIPLSKKIEDHETGDTRFAVYGFKSQAVFRMEDTDGAPVPTGDAELDNWIESLPLVDVAKAWDLTVTFYNGQEHGPHGKFIRGRAIALGVQNLSTFFHELIHAADHRLGNLTEKGQHWRSETVAEFGGAVLAKCLGLDYDADLGGAYRYVKAYAEAAGKRPEAACMDCLERLCKAVALVLDTAEHIEAEAGQLAQTA